MKKTERIEIRVCPEQKEMLRSMGNGNISKGFRQLLRAYQRLKTRNRKSPNPFRKRVIVHTEKPVIKEVMKD